ncbi:hypothetical protein NDU88_011208 [Pleurodeles waltl]|uniref:Uncharacterized protein n=2 Tax=Pleurodeles waltl TaxID=8319 RepID=A0AAV7S2W1_PLEWA|nr:hypothetical protein NDU88_011208 [Pleurodeles waltl]
MYFQHVRGTEAEEFLQWRSMQIIKNLKEHMCHGKAVRDSALETPNWAVDERLDVVTVEDERATIYGLSPPRQTFDEEEVESQGTSLVSINTEHDNESWKVAELRDNTEDICIASAAQDYMLVSLERQTSEKCIVNYEQDKMSLPTNIHARSLLYMAELPDDFAALKVSEWLESSVELTDVESICCSEVTNLLSEFMDVEESSVAKCCVEQTSNGELDISWKTTSNDFHKPNARHPDDVLTFEARQSTVSNSEKSWGARCLPLVCQKQDKQGVKNDANKKRRIQGKHAERVIPGPTKEVVRSTDVWVLPATPYRNWLPRLSRAEMEVRKFVNEVWGMEYPYVPEEVMDFVEANREEWLKCWIVEEIKKKRLSCHREDHPHFIKTIVRLVHNWQIGRSIRKHAVVYTDPDGHERLTSVRITLPDGTKVEKPDPDHYEL